MDGGQTATGAGRGAIEPSPDHNPRRCAEQRRQCAAAGLDRRRLYRNGVASSSRAPDPGPRSRGDRNNNGSNAMAAPGYVDLPATNATLNADAAKALGKALADTVERDHATMRGWFGGIEPSGGPIDVKIDLGSGGAGNDNVSNVDLRLGATANFNLARMSLVAEVMKTLEGVYTALTQDRGAFGNFSRLLEARFSSGVACDRYRQQQSISVAQRRRAQRAAVHGQCRSRSEAAWAGGPVQPWARQSAGAAQHQPSGVAGAITPAAQPETARAAIAFQRLGSGGPAARPRRQPAGSGAAT